MSKERLYEWILKEGAWIRSFSIRHLKAPEPGVELTARQRPRGVQDAIRELREDPSPLTAVIELDWGLHHDLRDGPDVRLEAADFDELELRFRVWLLHKIEKSKERLTIEADQALSMRAALDDLERRIKEKTSQREDERPAHKQIRVLK